MKRTVFALAALATLGFSGVAFAEDGGWTTTTGPAAMSDSDMDRVTAGAPGGTPGPNPDAGLGVTNNPNGVPPSIANLPSGHGTRDVYPGFGQDTAPGKPQ